MAKFVLTNVGRTNVNFTVYMPAAAGTELMSKAKQRKARNAGNINVSLKSNTSVDLVELTGLSVEDLMENPEVLELVRCKTDRVVATIETDTPEVVEPEVEPEPEVVPEPKVEPPMAAPIAPPKVEPPKVEPPAPTPPPAVEKPKATRKKGKKK